MAELSLKIGNTGETVSAEIDLDSTTNKKLIDTLIQEGLLKKLEEFEYEYSGYHLLGKDKYPIFEVDTLSNLGFKEGDDILILRRPIG